MKNQKQKCSINQCELPKQASQDAVSVSVVSSGSTELIEQKYHSVILCLKCHLLNKLFLLIEVLYESGITLEVLLLYRISAYSLKG